MKPAPVIALAGNPNVGKSTLFNNLTGMKQHTGNWAGKTVVTASGETEFDGERFRFVDLPGCYSVNPISQEEAAASDFISSPECEAAVVVCDACCLERCLIVALQIRAIAPRLLICVNLIDEAQEKGITINAEELSKRAGVPCVLTAARNGRGREELLSALSALLKTPPRERTPLPNPAETVKEAEEIAKGCVTKGENPHLAADKRADDLLTGKYTGFAVMLVLFAAVIFITVWGANYPSELLGKLFDLVSAEARKGMIALAAPEWLCGAIVDGILGVTFKVVSVMLPPMAIFFPLFTILEDVGYLPRVAFNLDRCFVRCGGCGKQALTMCMGLGCNAAAVTGCRIVESPREKLISILTNSFVPCNGRFPALIAIASIFFASGSAGGSAVAALVVTGLSLVSIGASFAASFLLSKTLLKGSPASFALELPPFRKPQIGKVIVRSIFDRTLFVLGRAVTVAAPAGLLIWVLSNVSFDGATLLSSICSFFDPAAKLFGVDGVVFAALLLGLPANEIVLPIALMCYSGAGIPVAGGLEMTSGLLISSGWSITTAICFMLLMLMHFPCATTILTIKKETGSTAMTLLATVLPLLFSLPICFLINLL